MDAKNLKRRLHDFFRKKSVEGSTKYVETMSSSGSPWTERSWRNISQEHNVYLPSSYSSLSICLWPLLKAEYQARQTIGLTMNNCPYFLMHLPEQVNGSQRESS